MMQTPLALAPLIILLPFLAFVILMTAGRWPKKWWHESHYVAILGIGSALGLSLYIAAQTYAASHGAESLLPAVSRFAWAPMGSLVLTMGIQLDGLAAVMLLVVTIVATMVQIYSVGYMHGDPRYSRFFAYLSLFSAAMLGLVLANNLLQLYIFWELVGLSSYLLIGFWFEKPEAMRAAKKAFIVTRLGDVGFFLGLLMLFRHAQIVAGPPDGVGLLEYSRIFELAPAIHALAPAALTTIALLIFCGAIGKSAQFPLHVWLPDAMEGPTPVSALIHAATMVAAGVYLVGRMFPLFLMADAPVTLMGFTVATDALHFVAGIGAITALIGATIGVLQNDIKRVLAYSTISQLGYMMIGLGVGGFAARLFHLTTHAFFKALLFLGSGSVIHGTGTQDMMEMGGLRKKMPWTFWTFLIGMLSLSGFPFLFSGFYSKEAILLGAYHVSQPIFLAGLTGAFLTAFYMTRLMALTFFGEPRKHDIHAHESPRNMTIPLAILAALSLGWWKFAVAPFHHFLDPHELSRAVEEVPLVGYLGMGAGLSGLALGVLVYRYGLGLRRALIQAPVIGARLLPGTSAPGVYTWVKNKYYFDELYWSTLVLPMLGVARASYWVDQKIVDMAVNGVGLFTRALAETQGWVDRNIVDGLVNATGWITGQVGEGFRRLQTGLVQSYAILAFVGLAAVVGLYLYLGQTATLP